MIMARFTAVSHEPTRNLSYGDTASDAEIFDVSSNAAAASVWRISIDLLEQTSDLRPQQSSD